MKRMVRDGKVYRMRRGELVEIPPEWVGQTVAQQTIRKRPSKSLHKHRKREKYGHESADDRLERERARELRREGE